MIIELAKKYINNILQSEDLRGIDKSCVHFPCHSTIDDCTWCYCPFYPCYSIYTGGKTIFTSDGKPVWSCKDCTWIHKKSYSQSIFKRLKERVKRIQDISREHLLTIFQEFEKHSLKKD